MRVVPLKKTAHANLVVLNDRGEEVTLTPAEKYHAEYMQRKVNRRFANALGWEVPITTLTTIMKKISEQKFFEIAPADYMPVRVGEGAWSTNLTTYRSFDVADQFENGIINTGGNNGKLATTDAAVDSLNIKVFNWAKMIGWSIFDLEFAAKAGNWDVVVAKEKARKRNWDLGVQRVAFLGARGNNASGGPCLGLLNQVGITFDTTLVTSQTGPISNMTTTQLNAFCATAVDRYRTNCNRSAWPTHLVLPESEYNGLGSQASSDFPIKSKLEVLLDMFKLVCRNPNFKILPCAYGDKPYSGLATQMYVMLNYDEESLRMDVPVDYTNTLANSLDNFSFQNVGYGQFTGVLAYRPNEMLYFGY